MERQDKREIVRRAKKKAEFAKKLTPLQKEYIDEIVSAVREREIVNSMNNFDLCAQGSLIENTDLSYKEIETIVYRAGELMAEALGVLKNKTWEEKVMTIRAIEEEVAEKVADMIFRGLERKEIVKAIKEEYKGTGLTTPEINIYWKKGIESYKKFIEEHEKKEAETKPSKGVKKAKKAVEPVEVAEVEEMSKFKVSNKVVKVISCDIAGEHGEYEINGGALVIKGTDHAFVNIPAVKNWASDRREALLKEIDTLNNLEKEAIEVMEEFMQ